VNVVDDENSMTTSPATNVVGTEKYMPSFIALITMSFGISFIGIVLLLGVPLLFASSGTPEQTEAVVPEEGEASESKGNPIAFWIAVVACWIAGSGLILNILALMLVPHH
jgi:hypothetical protein